MNGAFTRDTVLDWPMPLSIAAQWQWKVDIDVDEIFENGVRYEYAGLLFCTTSSCTRLSLQCTKVNTQTFTIDGNNTHPTHKTNPTAI